MRLLACRRYSRALPAPPDEGEARARPALLSIHNLRHYQVLMGRMREAILDGRFAALADEMRALWA